MFKLLSYNTLTVYCLTDKKCDLTKSKHNIILTGTSSISVHVHVYNII